MFSRYMGSFVSNILVDTGEAVFEMEFTNIAMHTSSPWDCQK